MLMQMIKISNDLKGLYAGLGQLFAARRNLLGHAGVRHPGPGREPAKQVIEAGREFDVHLCVHLPAVTAQRHRHPEETDHNRAELYDLEAGLTAHRTRLLHWWFFRHTVILPTAIQAGPCPRPWLQTETTAAG
jgi:hypothetical protein